MKIYNSFLQWRTHNITQSWLILESTSTTFKHAICTVQKRKCYCEKWTKKLHSTLHDLFINLYSVSNFHVRKHQLLIVLRDCVIRQNAKMAIIMTEAKRFARCLVISSQISFVTYDSRNGEIARQSNLSLSPDQTINFFPVLSWYRCTTSRIHRCSFPPYTYTDTRAGPYSLSLENVLAISIGSSVDVYTTCRLFSSETRDVLLG